MGHNGAVLGHSIPTSFPWVAGWSTDPRVLGRNIDDVLLNKNQIKRPKFIFNGFLTKQKLLV